MISAAPISVRCVPMSGMVMRAGTKVPMMLPAVESAKMRPATRPASSTPVAASRMANGVTMPSSTTGGAKSASDAAKEPTTAPVEMRLDALDREVEERPRHEGDRGHPCGGRQHDGRQQLRRGAPVRQAAAQPVAHGERGEDQADDVGPDDGRRAVVGGQQAGGADLGRHGADAGEEDEDGERERVYLPDHGASVPERSAGCTARCERRDRDGRPRYEAAGVRARCTGAHAEERWWR